MYYTYIAVQSDILPRSWFWNPPSDNSVSRLSSFLSKFLNPSVLKLNPSIVMSNRKQLRWLSSYATVYVLLDATVGQCFWDGLVSKPQIKVPLKWKIVSILCRKQPEWSVFQCSDVLPGGNIFAALSHFLHFTTKVQLVEGEATFVTHFTLLLLVSLWRWWQQQVRLCPAYFHS